MVKRPGMVCGMVFLATSLPSTDRTPVPPFHAGPVAFEIKLDGVFARRERLRAFPAEVFQTEKVVGEDRFTLEQVQTLAPKTPAKCVEHSFGASSAEFPRQL